MGQLCDELAPERVQEAGTIGVGTCNSGHCAEDFFDVVKGFNAKELLMVARRPEAGEAGDKGADLGEQRGGWWRVGFEMQRIEHFGVGHESSLGQVSAAHQADKIALAEN